MASRLTKVFQSLKISKLFLNWFFVLVGSVLVIVIGKVAVDASSTKVLAEFTIPDQAGETVVNQSDFTVTLYMPYGTDISNLTPTIVIYGVSVDPASGVAHDFTSMVTYTVTASDTTTQPYHVTVHVESDLTAYNAALAAVHQADYTSGSWTTYQGVVSSNVVTTHNTQGEVDAATSAITTAQGSLVFAGLADLDTAVSAAGAFSTREDEYTVASWGALTTALDMPTDTNTEVVAKTTAINDAITNLEFKGQADLNTAVAATEGLLEGTYTPETWSDLADAMAMPEGSNAEVIAKTSAINDAVAALVTKLLDAQTTAHANLVSALENNYVETDYTADNWIALTGFKTAGDTAINNALTVDDVILAKDAALSNMDSVDTKAETLAAAQDAAYTALTNAYGDYTDSDYTSPNWTILNACLTDGNNAIDNATVPGDVTTAQSTAISCMSGVQTIAEEAAAFQSSHTAALALSVETVAIINRGIVETAESDYDLLSVQAQGLLTSEKTLLDSLIVKLGALDIAAAVDAVNNATSEQMDDVLNANAATLGLDEGMFTTYTNLLSKSTVWTALVNKSFADAAAVQEAFDAAVTAEKATEDQAAAVAAALYAINHATPETIGQVIADNAEVLGLDLTDYNALTDKTSVHTALIDQGFMGKGEVQTAFDTLVGIEKAAEELALYKANALQSLADTLDGYIETDYTAPNWATLSGYKSTGDTAINDAESSAAVDTALSTAESAMAGVQTIAAEVLDFQTTHATALALTVDTVAVGNRGIVAAANTAYGLLSEDAQGLLTTQKTLIDALLAKLDTLDAEAEALAAVNAANSGAMPGVITTYHTILGLDLTDYTALSNQDPVIVALVGYDNFESIGEVKTTFDNAVATEKAIEALASATAAVGTAESSHQQGDVTTAQGLVTALPDGSDKSALQDRLDAVQDIIDATTAVETAESTHQQADVTTAQGLVTALPDGTDKTDLQGRLDAVQAIINLAVATTAVETAESSHLQANVTTAQVLVTALPDGSAKNDLQDRLDAVQDIIDLATAKVAAHSVLTSAFIGYIQNNYTSGNWTTLTGYKSAGDTAIDTALDLTGVSDALSTATDGMAGVEQDLANARVAAHSALNIALGTYTEGNYTPANWTVLTGYKTTGDAAIDSASTTTAVSSAQTTATTAMSGVQTIAQTLAATKIAVKAELTEILSTYVETNYTPGNWTTLTGFKTAADTAIDNASTVDEVYIARNAASVEMNGVETIGVSLQNAKNAVGALTSSDYTNVTWGAVTTAMGLPEATYSDKVTKIEAITNAIAALVDKADLSAYNAALAAVHQADYTQDSWDAYQLVVAANEVTVENSQGVVNDATAAITTAQADLVYISLVILGRPAILINDGNAYTNSENVTLTLSAMNATQMAFSNDGGNSWSTPEDYSTTKAYTLVGGDGNDITVRVRFFDVHGTQSGSDGCSASINVNSTLTGYDVEAVNQVIARIAALPAVGDLVLSDGAAVAAARGAYGTLTEGEPALVTNYATLTAAEARIAVLQAAADAAAIQAVIDQIGALPAVGDLVLSNGTAVAAARTAFDALSVDQQSLVVNISHLTEDEAQIAVLQAAADLASAKTTAHGALNTALAGYTQGNYTTENWTALTGYKLTGDSAIDAATDLDGVSAAQSTATTAMAGVPSIAQTLAAAKTAAHGVLTVAFATYIQGNYTSDNWTALNGFKSAGDTAIDAAADLGAVTTAQNTATAGMAGVQTIAQTLAAAKVTAHGALDTALAGYTQGNYTTENWTTLTGFKTAGDTAIDAATDLAGVSAAQTTATSGMAGVETIAQTLAATKTSAKAELGEILATYHENDYTPGNWTILTGYKTDADTAIDNALTIDAVYTARNLASVEMYGVQTIAQQLTAAKDAAAALTATDYTVASWGAVTDALALPETNNTEKADKTSAINAAIAALVSDTTGPVITINNPGSTAALSKTVTASTDNVGSPDTLTMFTNAVGVTTCDDSLSPFVSYSSTTFTSEADNGRTICYKAVDVAENVTYTVSAAIAGIDTSAPVMDAGTAQHTYPNMDVTFTGSSTDDVSGVDASTIVWTKESGPGTVTFGTDNALTTTAQADIIGTYTLRLTSADNLANSGNSDTQLIVHKHGDINNDGLVNNDDFTLLMFNWGDSPANHMADYDQSGTVDNGDFTIMMFWWGTGPT